jgi:hypothetical protein
MKKILILLFALWAGTVEAQTSNVSCSVGGLGSQVTMACVGQVNGPLTVAGSNLTLSSGQFLAPDGTANAPAYSFSNGTGDGIYHTGVNGNIWINNGSNFVGVPFSTVNGELHLGSGSDLRLIRDAANIFAQQNGTSAQTFRVYATYTDASNYRYVAYANNGMTLSAAGTGVTAAPLYIWNSQAGVINFATSNTSRWFMDANGHFLAFADNTYDIGAAQATRPRNLYLAARLDINSQFRIGPGSDGVVGFYNSNETTLIRIGLGGLTSSFMGIGGAGDFSVETADGSSDRVHVQNATKTLTDNSATTFARVTIASDSSAIVMLFYAVDAENATDQQTIGGYVTIPIINDAGAETCGTIVEHGEATATSVGTITSTITCTGAGTGTIDLALTSDSSLNVSPLLKWQAMLGSSAGVTIAAQ